MDFFTYVDRRQEEELLAAALDFAAAGRPVFPCRPGAKEPATHHGKDDATTRESLIRDWWRMKPHANVAIATGSPAVDVLDVDVKPDGSGFEAFNRAKRAGLLAGSSAIVHTPSGGLHAYYAGTDQRCGSLPRHLLDFKASGGYVLAPPSRVTVATEHGEEDRPYQWVERRDVEPSPLDWPAVKRLLDPPTPYTSRTSPGSGTGDIGPLARWLERQSEGNRNKALYWAATKALAAGLDSEEDGRALLESAVRSGLPEAQVQRTLASAYRTVKGGGQ